MSNYVPKIIYGDDNTEIVFPHPTERTGGMPFGGLIETKGKETISASGKRQTVVDRIEETYNLNQYGIVISLAAQVQAFYENHALRGNSFKYYPSSDETDFFTVHLKRQSYELEVSSLVGDDCFEFDLKMSLVRVL